MHFGGSRSNSGKNAQVISECGVVGGGGGGGGESGWGDA